MIQLTRLNSKPIIINCDLIELIDEMPDTIITLTTGRKILVEEPSSLVVERIIAFRGRCQSAPRPECAATTEARHECAARPEDRHESEAVL